MTDAIIGLVHRLGYPITANIGQILIALSHNHCESGPGGANLNCAQTIFKLRGPNDERGPIIYRIDKVSL